MEAYLGVLSRLYFISFSLGLLKNNRFFEFPYFLKKIIKQGDICLDIGANLGYLTVLFSKLVGYKGRVYAVEPVKPVLNVLRKNIKNLKNVEVIPYALGKENKTVKLGNNSISKKKFLATGSHFVMDNNAAHDHTVDIEFEAKMRKGSELFNHLNRLDLIKCDIEGYEMVVLEELEKIIVRFKPILLVESTGENRKKLLSFLGNRSFHAFVIHKGFLYVAKENEPWDILFVAEEKLPMLSEYVRKSRPESV